MEDVKLNRFVIHEIIKEAKSTEVKLIKSEKLGYHDDSANLLITEVHKSFKDNSALKHCHFEDRNDKIFKSDFEKYYHSSTDENFYKFSVNSILELSTALQKESLATGGYYVFVDYEFENKRFVSVMLLRKKDGLNLQMKNQTFTLLKTENLNIEKIAMGFRLNYSIYVTEGDQRNYIALITHQQDTISNYFKEWVAASGIIKNSDNTIALVKILNTIPLPIDENGLEFSRENFKQITYNLVNGSPNKIANLSAISMHFYGENNQTKLFDYAHENNIIIDNEFTRDSSKLRALVMIRAKVDGIELNVDYAKMTNKAVKVVDDKIIITSIDLAEQLKNNYNND